VIAYQKAFKKGKKKNNKFKIVLLGAEGAGKTSTAHSLLDKAFQPQQPSTVGAAVNTCTADRIFATKWKQVALDHQLKHIPKQFNQELKSCMSKLTKEPENAASSIQEETGTPTYPKEAVQPVNAPEEMIPDELVTKIQEVVDTQEVHDGDVQIIILDLGGQEIYYHVHFLFLAQDDIVFLAFDASKDLDDPVVCRQRLTRYKVKAETRGMQTNLQTIEIMMQSVYSHCGKAVDGRMFISNRVPTIILIATHSKGLSPQQKDAVISKIYQSFIGRPFMDHLPRSQSEAIFFIDNEDRDLEVFEALQRVALKAAAPTIAEECPISYLQFEVDILKESQSKAVISREAASTIADAFQAKYRQIMVGGKLREFSFPILNVSKRQQVDGLVTQFNNDYPQSVFRFDEKNKVIKCLSMNARQLNHVKVKVKELLEKPDVTTVSNTVADTSTSMSMTLPGGRRITLKQANIVEEAVDVIVKMV